MIAPEDPVVGDLSRLAGSCCPGPSADHWFGVDQQGRDELSRILYGARFSLLIGVVSVAVGLSIGMVLGSIAGYVGGVVDNVIMRLTDIMLAIPGLLLAIGIVAMLGPGLFQIMVAVGVTQIPIFTRLMRGSILGQRDNDFVLAARSIGVPRRSILGLPHPPERDLARDRAGRRWRSRRQSSTSPRSGTSGWGRRIPRRPSGGRC